MAIYQIQKRYEKPAGNPWQFLTLVSQSANLGGGEFKYSTLYIQLN